MLLYYFAFVDEEENKREFEQLYREFRNPMYAYACMVLGRYKASAEDVVQNTFIALARNMKVIVPLSTAGRKAYVFTAVYHAALDMIRHEPDTCDIDADGVDALFSTSDADYVLNELCAKESHQRIVQAIQTLPDIYAGILMLYYLNDLELSEIAKQFQIKPGTVRKRFSRGRNLLIQLLRKEEVHPYEYQQTTLAK